MSGWTLRLRQAPALRLDLRGITPAALGALRAADVERLPVGHGRRLLPLAECFGVAPRNDDSVVLEGDLARCDRLGWQMDGGRLIVDGAAGDYVGAGMSAGEITVWGDAGALAACEMAGGTLIIEGSVGDFAASTLPGSLDGMRGGTVVVRGHAGARLGDRMRRGTVVVFGDVGDFVASRLVAGTIAVAGRPGAHGGYAMRRGSVVFAGSAPDPPATFVPAIADVPVFWQLLACDLASHGGPFASLPARRIERHLGDLAVDGKGEWIVVR
ncbi:MAG TPA: formylmethanofuran dehydrogenase subunit C [Burkholderiaceae bacterium]|nr:formylmethanofuran dehydrogenase subunit C [Burkholderiaceae bacterium]